MPATHSDVVSAIDRIMAAFEGMEAPLLEILHAVQRELGVPGICGEWSLGLDLKVVSLWAPGPYNHALEDLDGFQVDVANRGYAAAQVGAFEHYRGWFFWSYRTETTPSWCFRECVGRGWLPASFS